MMSLHVSVRDPPSTDLRPPPADFVDTIAEPSFNLEFAEAPTSLGLGLPLKYHATPIASSIPRLARPIEHTVTLDPHEGLGRPFEPAPAQDKHAWTMTAPRTKVKVPKKRRSLQSILIPSFLQSPPALTNPLTAPPHILTRTRSQSAPKHPNASSSTTTLVSSKTKSPPRSASPSPFLIDDDPFANISSPPSATAPAFISPERPSVAPNPPSKSRSPLSPTFSAPTSPTRSTTPIPPLPILPIPVTSERPSLSRPKSSGNGQVRPAYTKPAFTPRPSLPSLHTLAQMNIVIPKKARKGTVGARLPHEPWNMDMSREYIPSRDPTPTTSTSTAGSSTSKPRFGHTADFTLSLGSEISDFPIVRDVEEEEEEEEEDDAESYGVPLTDYPPSLSYTPTDLSSYSLSRSSSLASVDSSWSARGQAPSNRMHSLSPGSSSDLGDPSDDYNFDRYPDHDPLNTEPDFDYYWDPSPDMTLHPANSKSRSRSRSPSPELDVGPTPHSSFYRTSEDFDVPGRAPFEIGVSAASTTQASTSASTIRSSLHEFMGEPRPDSSLLPERPPLDFEPMDGNGWDGREGNDSRGYRDDWDYQRSGGGPRGNGGSGGGGGGGRRGGDSHGRSAGAGGGGGGRDRDGDDGKGRRPSHISSVSTPSESEDDAEEEEEASTDDYGNDSASIAVLPPSMSRHVNTVPESPSGASSTTDDDVPLARQIPTALRAQKTIRRQVRDERDQRRRERAEVASTGTMPSRLASASQRAGTEEPPEPVKAPDVGVNAPRSMGRQRTMTMPSSTTRPFAVDDLTKKLLNVQAHGSPPAAMLQPTLSQGKDASGHRDDFLQRMLSVQAAAAPTGPGSTSRPRSSQGRDQQWSSANDHLAFTQQNRPSFENVSRERTIRPMRSQHGLSNQATDGYLAAPVESGSAQRLGRSATSARSRRPDDAFHNAVSPPTSYDARVSRDKSLSRDKSISRDKSTSRSHRSSEETRRPSFGQTSASARGSAEYDTPQRNIARPPMPPLPPAEVLNNLAHQPAPRIQITQQRIFIGDKQRFNMVEISASTNAGEVVEMLESQNSLEKLGAGSGGWMLWEIAQDFGMERPIRDYELLSDVEGSWNKDKLVNIFVVKKTPLAPILSRTAIPPSSPRNRGYVEWESKRGKWSKRWMELREHSLWLAKRDTGKDETFLCSMSNFDVYYVGKLHKAPRPFVFAIKSTDNLSLFENARDYVHFFSCNQKDGETWMQSILLARSYVLYQERNILFTDKSAPPTSNLSSSKSLSRSGTRKQSSAHRPAQPLVSAPAPFTVAPPLPNFEPGSLLAKRGDY